MCTDEEHLAELLEFRRRVKALEEEALQKYKESVLAGHHSSRRSGNWHDVAEGLDEFDLDVFDDIIPDLTEEVDRQKQLAEFEKQQAIARVSATRGLYLVKR